MHKRFRSSIKTATKRHNPPNVTWKHIWPLDEIQNALSESYFRALPNEIMLHIFQFLSVHDLCNASLVCRSFKMIADHDDIWKLKWKCKFMYCLLLFSLSIYDCYDIALTKLHSKSLKQIFMNWTYEKYLRNIERIEVETMYRQKMSKIYCRMRLPPPRYPTRPESKHQFVPIGGFKQHPNESQTM